MNMFQLFRELPRDLQWEVLSIFVGSHAVRKGKLIARLVPDDRSRLIERIPRVEVCHIHLYKINYNAKTFVCFRNGNQILYCENPRSGEAGYTYRRKIPMNHSNATRTWNNQYTPLAVSLHLQTPYVKTTYPSYLDTEKKKAARITFV